MEFIFLFQNYSDVEYNKRRDKFLYIQVEVCYPFIHFFFIETTDEFCDCVTREYLQIFGGLKYKFYFPFQEKKQQEHQQLPNWISVLCECAVTKLADNIGKMSHVM